MAIIAEFCVYILISININAISIEDDNPYTNTFNSYSPSTVNFQDIYTNTLIHSEENPIPSTDVDSPSNSISTQYAEFHPKVLKISAITPSPKILINSSYITTSTTEISMTYTEEPENIKVVPLRSHQKGVLDILFPAARVKSFKSVFDSLKRFLSHTFRRK